MFSGAISNGGIQTANLDVKSMVGRTGVKFLMALSLTAFWTENLGNLDNIEDRGLSRHLKYNGIYPLNS
jgi:hypothetical protein